MLCLSYTIWQRKFGSTFAMLMACCFTVLSHYLNQCWLFISDVLWFSPESNSIASGQATVPLNEFENYTVSVITTSSRDHWVQMLYINWIFFVVNWTVCWQLTYFLRNDGDDLFVFYCIIIIKSEAQTLSISFPIDVSPCLPVTKTPAVEFSNSIQNIILHTISWRGVSFQASVKPRMSVHAYGCFYIGWYGSILLMLSIDKKKKKQYITMVSIHFQNYLHTYPIGFK